MKNQKSDELTASQERVLECALSYFYSEDNFPTQRKLGFILGIYQNAVKEHLLQIEEKGWIEKNEDGKYRRTLKCLEIYYSHCPPQYAARSKFQSPRKKGPKGIRDERENSVH